MLPCVRQTWRWDRASAAEANGSMKVRHEPKSGDPARAASDARASVPGRVAPDTSAERNQAAVDQALDEALAETFPASDPVAVHRREGT
jgi:hypothetical protein